MTNNDPNERYNLAVQLANSALALGMTEYTTWIAPRDITGDIPAGHVVRVSVEVVDARLTLASVKK